MLKLILIFLSIYCITGNCKQNGEINVIYIWASSSRAGNVRGYTVRLNYTDGIVNHSVLCRESMVYYEDESDTKYSLEVSMSSVDNITAYDYKSSNKTLLKLRKINISVKDNIEDTLNYYTDLCHPIPKYNHLVVSGYINYYSRKSSITTSFKSLRLSKKRPQKKEQIYEKVNGIVTKNQETVS
jgi:hypothetical protein